MGGLFFSFSLLPVLGLEDRIFPFDLLCFITFKVVFVCKLLFTRFFHLPSYIFCLQAVLCVMSSAPLTCSLAQISPAFV